jgi:hypothetical protein
MLRKALIAFGAICALTGAALLLGAQSAAGFGPLAFGLLVLLGTLLERVRYKPIETEAPGAGWVATDERFVDGETGVPVRVWQEPATGERRYVAD